MYTSESVFMIFSFFFKNFWRCRFKFWKKQYTLFCVFPKLHFLYQNLTHYVISSCDILSYFTEENYWSNFTKSNEEQISLPAYLTFILSKENMVMGRDKTKIRVFFDDFLESISQSLNEKWGGIEEKSCSLGMFYNLLSYRK